jgi:hypothetical protein
VSKPGANRSSVIIWILLVVIYVVVGHAGFRGFQRYDLAGRGQYVANLSPVGISSGIVVIKAPIHFDINFPLGIPILQRGIPNVFLWFARHTLCIRELISCRIIWKQHPCDECHPERRSPILSNASGAHLLYGPEVYRGINWKIPNDDHCPYVLGRGLPAVVDDEGPRKRAIQCRLDGHKLDPQLSSLVYPHFVKLGRIDARLNYANASDNDCEQGHYSVGGPPSGESSFITRYFCEFGVPLGVGLTFISALVFGAGFWRVHRYLLSAFCVLLGVMFILLAVFLGHVVFEPTNCQNMGHYPNRGSLERS